MAKKAAVNKGGRPPKGDKAFDSKLIFECMAADKERWREKATRLGQSLGEVIREQMNRWVSRK